MYVRNPLLRVDKNDTYWQASRISRVFWSGMLTLVRQTCAPSRLHCPRTLSYHRKKSNYVMSYKISRMINLTNLWRNHSTNRILNVNKEDGKHKILHTFVTRGWPTHAVNRRACNLFRVSPRLCFWQIQVYHGSILNSKLMWYGIINHLYQLYNSDVLYRIVSSGIWLHVCNRSVHPPNFLLIIMFIIRMFKWEYYQFIWRFAYFWLIKNRLMWYNGLTLINTTLP